MPISHVVDIYVKWGDVSWLYLKRESGVSVLPAININTATAYRDLKRPQGQQSRSSSLNTPSPSQHMGLF